MDGYKFLSLVFLTNYNWDNLNRLIYWKYTVFPINDLNLYLIQIQKLSREIVIILDKVFCITKAVDNYFLVGFKF